MSEVKEKKPGSKNDGSFSLKLENSRIIKSIIETLSNIIDETMITITKDGLCIKAMDPSRICLLQFIMKEKDFDEFECSSTTEICLNLDDLDKIMKRSAADDSIEIKFKEDDNKIKIIMKKEGVSRSRTFSLAILDSEQEEIQMEKLLQIEYPAKWQMDPNLFTEAIKDAEIYSEILNLKTNEKGLTFSSSGQIGEMIYDLPKEDLIDSEIEGENLGAYSINFLKSIMKLSGITEKLDISLKTDHPIKLIFNILEGAVLSYFLAPRVESADFEDDDMGEL